VNKIIELREKRAQAWESAKAFLDAKQDVNGRLSAEDAAAYDKMEADVVALGKDIERLERAREIGTDITAATSLPITSVPGASASTKTGRASDEYKQAFWNAVRGREITGALKIGSDPDGGYLVPDEFERTLIEALEEQNIFRPLATVIRTASGERQIPVAATKGTASWVEEEALILESNDTFGQITLGAYKLATMIKISTELLNDSAFNMEAYIAKEFARRIGVKEEEAFFVGDGSKKPTGILADTGGAPVAKTTASTTAVTFDEVLDLLYALKTPYRAKASFVTNDSTMKMLRKLKDSNGQYLWQPSIKEGTPDMIVGKPIHTSGFVPAIAAGAKALMFGDYSYYWIADRQSRTFQRLNELFATTGQVGFIATQRVDGKLILPEAVQVLQMAASS
jgi:HK97 family phage major capsid protein